MSQINVDNIKNRLGSGAPSFPNGIDVSAGVTTFTNGLNVGTGASLFSPASNVLTLGTNSAERVRITSSGDVGISTDTPGTLAWRTGQTLDVFAGSGNATGQLYLGANRGDGTQSVGSIIFYDNTQTASHQNVAIIEVDKAGVGTNTRGGDILFYNKADDGTSTPVTFKIRSGGNCEIPDGNLVFASGHGIDFSATGDGSGTMSSELLDDYEEGTWTPVLKDNSGNEATMTVQQGFYTKTGDIVNAWFQVAWSSLGSLTGNVRIEGWPFSSKANSSNYYYIGATISNQTTVGCIAMAGNGTVANMQPLTGPSSNQTGSNLSSSGRMMCSLTYFT